MEFDNVLSICEKEATIDFITMALQYSQNILVVVA